MHKVTLKAKLVVSFLVVSAIVGLTSYVGVTSLQRVHDRYDTIVAIGVPSVEALSSMRQLAYEVQIELTKYREAVQTATPQEIEAQRDHLIADLDVMAKTEREYLKLEELEEESGGEVDESAGHTALTETRERVKA